MLISVFAVCQLVSGPLLGHASRIARAASRCSSSARSAPASASSSWRSARSLWMLYLSRIIDGVTAGNLSLAQAYIADNTAPEDRAKSFGLIGIAFGLGFFIGPSVTGFLSARYGLHAPIYLAAVHVGDEHSVHGDAPAQAAASRQRRRAAERTGGQRLVSRRTYTQYFARPGSARAARCSFSSSSLVLTVHLRIRAVRRTPVHVAGPSVRPARDRLPLRLRRASRHHPAGRTHRTAREAFR